MTSLMQLYVRRVLIMALRGRILKVRQRYTKLQCAVKKVPCYMEGGFAIII